MDLICCVEGVLVYVIGMLLIMNSDGMKFGKSEGNVIWFDVEMCSFYWMY